MKGSLGGKSLELEYSATDISRGSLRFPGQQRAGWMQNAAWEFVNGHVGACFFLRYGNLTIKMCGIELQQDSAKAPGYTL